MDIITHEDYQSKYLDDEHPILIRISIARALNSDRQAYFLQQVRYWITINKKKPLNQHYYNDGRWWMYNTLDDWHEQFPWLSVRTIQRIIKELKLKGILITGNYNKKKYDKTIWYSIDEHKLDEIIDEHMTVWTKCPHGSGQNDHMDLDKMAGPIPETLSVIKKERVPQQEKSLSLSSKNEKTKTTAKEGLSLYCKLYEKHRNTKPAVNNDRDGKTMRELITDHGIEAVEFAIENHVKDPDEWTEKGGCTIPQLKNNFSGYMVEYEKERNRRRIREQRIEQERIDDENRRKIQEEAARKKAAFDALPEVDKCRQRLKDIRDHLEPRRQMWNHDALQGEEHAIEKLNQFISQEREHVEAIKAAGGEEADQLLKELKDEERRLSELYLNNRAEVPF